MSTSKRAVGVVGSQPSLAACTLSSPKSKLCRRNGLRTCFQGLYCSSISNRSSIRSERPSALARKLACRATRVVRQGAWVCSQDWTARGGQVASDTEISSHPPTSSSCLHDCASYQAAWHCSWPVCHQVQVDYCLCSTLTV